MAQRVAIQPISPRWSKWRGVGALVTGQAVTPATFYRAGLAQQLLQWQEEKPVDAVLTFCTGMIRYARLLTAPGGHGVRLAGFTPRHVLDLVDVDSLKWRSYAREAWPPLSWVYAAEARRLRRLEAGRADHLDAITVVSDNEADAYRRFVGPHDHLVVVGNGVDLDYFHPLPDPDNHRLVFVGVLNYRPNVEGISWFVKRVLPLVRQRLPDAELAIVGRHPVQKVHDLGMEPGVHVVGSVPDVRLHLADAAVVIAPLLIARGVQNKVLEAMASGRAVVCTPEAAGGLSDADRRCVRIADGPQSWVDALYDLLTNRDQRARLAAAARTQVQAAYAWERRLAPMVDLLRGSSV